MWINQKYIDGPINFNGYKVLLSKANGAGKFGENFSEPQIVEPEVGHTQSFISIGNEKKRDNVEFIVKYIKTKLFRCLLSVLKTTQDISAAKMKFVPNQDFTASSDIDWSKSISDIDQQLYRKYNLDDMEIQFIETHVKEMK